MAAYRYIVRGRVQGVGYRYFVRQEASRLGVAGFTRNLPDGTVEVMATAAEEALVNLEACLRRGPSFSTVEDVLKESAPPRADEGFHIR